jgi:Tol biopolymer transport system component
MTSSLSRCVLQILFESILIGIAFVSCQPVPTEKTITPEMSSGQKTETETRAPHILTPTVTYFFTPIPTSSTAKTTIAIPTMDEFPYGHLILVAGSELYLINANCTNISYGCDTAEWIKLTNTPRPEQQFASEIIGDQITASPDGNMIAFAYRESVEYMGLATGGWDIYAVDVNECLNLYNGCGSQQLLQLTAEPGDDISPAWSPMGDKITFVSNRGHNAINISSLWMMAPNGSKQHSVFEEYIPGQISNPNWSPDGTQLLFNADVYLSNDYHPSSLIFISDAYGLNARQITKLPTNQQGPINKLDWHPQWSPNGEQIVFESNRENDWRMYLINPNGTNLRRLSYDIEGSYPHWSPNGRRIAFLSLGNLFVVDRDGNNLMQLTDSEFIHNYIWIP